MADPDPHIKRPSSMGDQSEPPRPSQRRWLRIALLVCVPLILAAVGGYFYLIGSRYATTDNAYVHRDSVSISAEISGRIVEVAVGENDIVEAGDLLLRIDPEPYRIALQQAEADLAAARVDIAGLRTRASGSSVDIAAARDDISFAEDSFERQRELLNRGFTTRARFDEAQHDLTQARERLRAAEAAKASADAALGRGGGGDYPAVAAAQARIEQAKVNLARTEIRSPVSGMVTQTDRLQVGQQMVSGVPALTVVASDRSWIEANFKETDLAHILPGQPVAVEIDAYPDVELTGHVASIGAGTGSNFALLPAQNATGNWVKVTQRVPVRIEIDEPSPRPLLAGLSATVKVDIRGDGDR